MPLAKFTNLFAVIFCLLILQACAPSRVVAPLPAGEQQVNVHFGGPLYEYDGDTMPMPLTSVAYSLGVDENNGLTLAAHTTALVYGLLQAEAAWTHGLLEPSGYTPGISTTPAMHMMIDRWQQEFRAYPALDFHAYWLYAENAGLVYFGFGQWFELQQKRSHGEKQPRQWLPYWQVGTQYWFDSWGAIVELKRLLPNVSNEKSVVEYRGGVSHGAVGIYFSLGRKF